MFSNDLEKGFKGMFGGRRDRTTTPEGGPSTTPPKHPAAPLAAEDRMDVAPHIGAEPKKEFLPDVSPDT